jgi:hypothetical protein
MFSLLHRQPPKEVIQAACDFYGISSQAATAVRAEKLKALSDNIWIVNVNKDARVVVAYNPGDTAVAAPWFE